ncbi:MAG: hypothetical protein U1A78_19205 [Polyangia bacterium]
MTKALEDDCGAATATSGPTPKAKPAWPSIECERLNARGKKNKKPNQWELYDLSGNEWE